MAGLLNLRQFKIICRGNVNVGDYGRMVLLTDGQTGDNRRYSHFVND